MCVSIKDCRCLADSSSMRAKRALALWKRVKWSVDGDWFLLSVGSGLLEGLLLVVERGVDKDLLRLF